MLSGIDIFDEARPSNTVQTTKGLRAHGPYKDIFLKELLKGAVGIKHWRAKHNTVYISDFVDESLETFAVLAYVNGYDKWMKYYHQRKNRDEPDRVTNRRRRYNFTADSRGAGSYEGWSRQGKTAYNKILHTLEGQRALPETGRELEKQFLQENMALSLSGGSPPAKRDREIQYVEVKNKLSKLLDKI